MKYKLSVGSHTVMKREDFGIQLPNIKTVELQSFTHFSSQIHKMKKQHQCSQISHQLP